MVDRMFYILFNSFQSYHDEVKVVMKCFILVFSAALSGSTLLTAQCEPPCLNIRCLRVFELSICKDKAQHLCFNFADQAPRL